MSECVSSRRGQRVLILTPKIGFSTVEDKGGTSF